MLWGRAGAGRDPGTLACPPSPVASSLPPLPKGTASPGRLGREKPTKQK